MEGHQVVGMDTAARERTMRRGAKTRDCGTETLGENTAALGGYTNHGNNVQEYSAAG
jgi:hypothetical protein